MNVVRKAADTAQVIIDTMSLHVGRQRGDRVLEALGLQGQTFVSAMKYLAALTGGNLLLSWFGLVVTEKRHRRNRHKRKRKFLGGKAFTLTEHNGTVDSSLNPSSAIRMPTKLHF